MNIIVHGGATANALRAAIEQAKVHALVHMNSATHYFERADRWTFKDVDTINHHLNHVLKAIRYLKKALASQPSGAGDVTPATQNKQTKK